MFVSRHHDNPSVIVKNEGKYREYTAGESCKPEVCSESCERKGRAHFHLKLCPGGKNCAANLYPYVRHSTDRWYPFVHHEYDLWLCEACQFSSSSSSSLKENDHSSFRLAFSRLECSLQ